MVNQMVWNNLMFRKTRTVLSVIAVAVEVLLIVSTVGLVNGMVHEIAQRNRAIGADILVQAPGASFLVGLNNAPMSVKFANLFEKVPHVSVVAPTLIQSSGGLTVVFGIDDRFRQLSGPFKVIEGRDLQDGEEALIDDVYARDNRKKVGDTVEFWNTKFTVVGVVEHGKGARLFVPLATSQRLNSSEGKVSMFYIRLDDPKNTGYVLEIIKAQLRGYTVRSMEEYTSLMTVSGFPGLKPFVAVMITISVTVGFLVIFLAMYTTVLERTREIGILKSMGGSKLYIANLLFREVTMIALCGIVVGVAASFLLRVVVLKKFPTLTIEITEYWMVCAAVIAIAGSLVGALYPAVRAAKQDPIAALAYE